jgi:hypothetical protein
MPLARRRHATYVGGSCVREDVGRNPHAAYVIRVTLMSADRSLRMICRPAILPRVVLHGSAQAGKGFTQVRIGRPCGDLSLDGFRIHQSSPALLLCRRIREWNANVNMRLTSQ